MPGSNDLPHLLIEGFFTTEKYTKPSGGGGGEYQLPARDRATHGTSLRQQLEQARQQNEQIRGISAPPETPATIVLEVRSEPSLELALERLESRSQGISLACVRTEEGGQRVATIHVAEGRLNYFVQRVEEYLEKDTKSGNPRNQELIDRISEIRLATLRSFWTDEASPFPADNGSLWWEVWLRAETDQGPWDTFRLLSQAAGLRVGGDTIRFPDRLVGLCYGTAAQLSSSIAILDLLAEVRKAKANPGDFLRLSPREQGRVVGDFLTRVVSPPAESPGLCILDRGVVLNPLLRPALSVTDCLTYDPGWPLADPWRPTDQDAGHGTELAGIALYGDSLADRLSGVGSLRLRHRLESVRILPPRGQQNDPRLYGAITAQAIYRMESVAVRPRCYCMAVTTEGTDNGKPSSWSGEIDQLCAGVGGSERRLIVLATGNTDPGERNRYPASNDTDPVEDPAQAWNAITVGASTNRWTYPKQDFPDCQPVAMPGDLGPSSTTSLTWNTDWPYKPDVVMEGGNHVVNQATGRISEPDEMTLLTTAHTTEGRLLVSFGETSAAAAQAARIAAILQAEYPHYWPETIRGLLIHSAEWTERMRTAFEDVQSLRPKERMRDRLRRYGYGVPSLQRALYSARNSLTLIAQQTLSPFMKDGSEIKTGNMGLHKLPWPKQELLGLGHTEVQMRVTLSYFIEPKPGRRGFSQIRHSYQSHGLRFDVQRPQESVDEFRQRINREARDDDEGHVPTGDSDAWILGKKLRTRGSLHSDWWNGRAADLAACEHIAVFPVSGWWRDKTDRDYWTRQARYSLIVSIRTAATIVNLYAAVLPLIGVPTPIEMESA